jgi:hypothetical protein
MGLEVEIVEHGSIIVVTITGPTDIAALQPLRDALEVAVGEGQTIVVDISELTHTSSWTAIIDALGPAVATRTVVVRSPGSPQLSLPRTGAYTSVDAAIEAIRAERSPNGNTNDTNLTAKFDDLSDRYAKMISHRRQLLSNIENPP